MEEMEDMTVLCLGIGASSGGKPKSPAQFHDLFPAPLEEKDHKLVMKKERKTVKNARCNGLEDQDGSNSSNGRPRKKLRLKEEQLTLLETVYEEHSNLDPALKQALAEQLSIRPRQIEVWFQNRRARSKQKQTEADREHLKRWCEGLNNENQRLKKELQELRLMRPSLPCHDQTQLLIMCSSCKKNSERPSQ